MLHIGTAPQWARRTKNCPMQSKIDPLSNQGQGKTKTTKTKRNYDKPPHDLEARVRNPKIRGKIEQVKKKKPRARRGKSQIHGQSHPPESQSGSNHVWREHQHTDSAPKKHARR